MGRDLDREPPPNRLPRIHRPEPQEREASTRVRDLHLNETAVAALRDIGRFRTVAVQDLARFSPGRKGQSGEDLKTLAALGLVQKRTAWFNRNVGRLEVAVLTKAGKRYLEEVHPEPGQAVYSGFVKPSEVAHDAAIYPMFQKEKAAIEAAGGRVRRLVLDYELKRSVYAPLAKVRGKVSGPEYARHQAEVARANYLKVVDGKIPLPDLRIEYENEEGQITRVDLELATHHYHGSHMAQKAEAGFKIYGADDGVRRSSIYEGREITAQILSL